MTIINLHDQGEPSGARPLLHAADLTELLLHRALPELSKSELERLALDAAIQAEMASDNAASLYAGLACLVACDNNTQSGAGIFRSDTELLRLLSNVSDQFRHIQSLAHVSNEAMRRIVDGYHTEGASGSRRHT